MHVAELWRYPVKSLKGEQIQEAQITSNGIPGDREIVVLNSAGRIVTSRTRPKLLGLNGRLGADGIPTINGIQWDSAEAGELVNQAVGGEVRLVQVPQPQAFDVLPLLIATDGATQFLNIDRRRLRPNILLADVAGLSERDWPGRTIKIGNMRIQAVKLRARCVMTTFDPDTQEQDKSVLIKIIRDLDGTAALDCSVIQPGVIRVGDGVEID
jgi:MOSC domain-containing protein